jgi:uncharacterized membrane protein
MRHRHEDLSRPRRPRRSLGIHYDPDAFGEFSEAIARNLGTARFLVIQTVIVFVWIMLNITVVALRWDPYPFILLNLAFSTQAAYAAPLILLAQNRQEDRDRAQAETDRRTAERTQADAEFLAREIASVRLSLGDMVTMEQLGDRLDNITESLRALNQRLADEPPEAPGEGRARAGAATTPDEPPNRRAVG